MSNSSSWYWILGLLFLLTPSEQQSQPQLLFSLRDSYTLRPDVIATVRLCLFAGNPAPEVTWTVDGDDLPTSAGGGRGVYYLPGNGTLVIERAGSDDDGMYQCVGTNSVGSAMGDTQLTFVRTGVPWYISWYMWFVYAILFWALTIPLFIGWFFYQKKKAEHNLPPADGWIGN